MGEPLISVVMSVYNDRNFLQDALDSILAQSEGNFEFIIVDDASTDGTAEMIKSYKDQRIRLYVNSENMGLTKNLNKGLKLAKGRYIARMDGDDISYPDRFRKQLEYLEKHRDIMLVSCWTRFIGESHLIVDMKETPEQLRAMMLLRPVLMHPGFMMRRELLEKGFLYDESFRTTQDYDFQVRVSEKYPVGLVNEILLDYRVHKKQVSSSRNAEQSRNADRVRFGQLDRLGIRLTSEEEGIYRAWAFEEINTGCDKFREAEGILKKILSANEKRGIYDADILCQELYILLFQWIVKSRVKGKLWCVGSICGFHAGKWKCFWIRMYRLAGHLGRKYAGRGMS